MLESVPQFVETAIYGYFVLVAALGVYLHGRLWFGRRNRDERAESGPELDG